jgi:curved DNA-binding protein CbpA
MHLSSGDVDCYAILQVHPLAHPTVITAAYRALARLLHPDHAGEGTDPPMARLNRAYAILRDPETRRSFDHERAALANAPKRAAPTTTPAATPPPPASDRRGSVLPYGRYAGWALQDLVRQDIDYLRWLARHPSGRQYQAEIARLLTPKATTAGSAGRR